MSESTDPYETTETPPRRAGHLAAAVAAEVGAQRSQQAIDAATGAAYEEPAFDKRKGKSNFGHRVAAKIALATS